MNIEERKREQYIQETLHMFSAGAKQAAIVLKDGTIAVVYEDEYEDVIKELHSQIVNIIRVA